MPDKLKLIEFQLSPQENLLRLAVILTHRAQTFFSILRVQEYEKGENMRHSLFRSKSLRLFSIIFSKRKSAKVFWSVIASATALFFLNCAGGGGGGSGSSPAPTTDIAPVDTPFSFSLPAYITDVFSTTTRTLEFAFVPMDWWGKSYNPSQTRYEPSKEYVDSVLDRGRSIGSSVTFFTQFYVLHGDYSIQTQTYEGAMTATVQEMTDYVTKAKAKGYSKVILFVNLYGQNASITSAIADLHNSPVPSTINQLLDNWKPIITQVAADAEAAGFDGLVVDPRDIYFFFTPASYAAKWQQIITDVKAQFTGKIFFFGGRGTLIDFSNSLTGIDGYIVDEGNIQFLAAVTDENIGSLKTAWDAYLTEANMVADLVAKGDTYILALISSYDGSIQNGWVEPWGEYPDGTYTQDMKEQAVAYEALFQSIYGLNTLGIKGVISYGYWWSNSMYPTNYWQRSDIAHSIRLKDAEHVFYRWTQIFNQ